MQNDFRPDAFEYDEKKEEASDPAYDCPSESVGIEDKKIWKVSLRLFYTKQIAKVMFKLRIFHTSMHNTRYEKYLFIVCYYMVVLPCELRIFCLSTWAREILMQLQLWVMKELEKAARPIVEFDMLMALR